MMAKVNILLGVTMVLLGLAGSRLLPPGSTASPPRPAVAQHETLAQGPLLDPLSLSMKPSPRQ
jgi:hypothetical protein